MGAPAWARQGLRGWPAGWAGLGSRAGRLAVGSDSDPHGSWDLRFCFVFCRFLNGFAMVWSGVLCFFCFFLVFPRFSFRLRQTGFQAGLGWAGLRGGSGAGRLAVGSDSDPHGCWDLLFFVCLFFSQWFCYGLKWGASFFSFFFVFPKFS